MRKRSDSFVGITSNYPNVPDSVHESNKPEIMAYSVLAQGKTVDEVAELFDLPIDYVKKLESKYEVINHVIKMR